MRLADLVKPIDQCTEEELLERLRRVRHNREIARPVAAKVAERAERKSSGKRMSTLEKLVEGMSESDRAKLIESLKE